MSRTVLIVYPHWPPSNLAGVHRVRLIANALPDHGWHPIVLTVDERDHEESLDPELTKLVSSAVEVIKVRARQPWKVFGKRIVGDIGLRGWKALKAESKAILGRRKVDFIWYSLPSWYPCLQGAGLSKKFSVPFAIDYQDPWVYDTPPSMSWWHRERWTARLACILEPRALKGCSFISAINEDYMEGPLQRHFNLRSKPNLAIQLGFDARDHNIHIDGLNDPWPAGTKSITYAGTYWAQGEPVFDLFLDAVKQLSDEGLWPEAFVVSFIGTTNPSLLPLKEKADKMGIGDIIHEYPDRVPYLHAQQFLRHSHAVMAFGSTAAHYSPSKVFQLLLSGRPILACFHPSSSIFDILSKCDGDLGMSRFYENDLNSSRTQISQSLTRLFAGEMTWNPQLSQLDRHSASSNAKKLANTMESVLS